MAEFPLYEPEKVLARNTSPEIQDQLSYWSMSSGDLTFLPGGGVSGRGAFEMKTNSSPGASTFVYMTRTVPISPGEWVGFGADVKAGVGSPRYVLRVLFQNSDGATVGASPYITDSRLGDHPYTRSYGSAQAPATAISFRTYIYLRAGDDSLPPPPNVSVIVSGWSSVVAASQATAEKYVAGYFDGDVQIGKLLRRNLARNPLGPGVTDVNNIRSSDPDGVTVVSDGGRNVLQQVENGGSFGLYFDQSDNFSPPVGALVHFCAEVKMTEDSLAPMRLRFPGYNGAQTSNQFGTPNAVQSINQGWVKHDLVTTTQEMPSGAYSRALVYPGTTATEGFSIGGGYRVRNYLVEYGTTGPFFDGDTEDTPTRRYAWDGAAGASSSAEYEIVAGAQTRWLPDGTSELFIPEKNTDQLSGVFEVGASTEARLGIVSDIYSRSREKIQLKLAGVDDLIRSGHRIELAAAAMTSTPAVWHWRQVTGPTVALNVRENTCDFIAPDVERSTRIRIGVYAASEDGGNRSDWHYFDLDVEPPMLRFRGGDDGDFSPRSPYLVGYSRGKREIWNDVIRPATYEKNPRHELEVLDLGIPDDDVVFSTETPRRMAAGGVWVNPETGDVFRNFGAGYNETDDTTASPRTSTYWVNPANGDILEWIED